MHAAIAFVFRDRRFVTHSEWETEPCGPIQSFSTATSPSGSSSTTSEDRTRHSVICPQSTSCSNTTKCYRCTHPAQGLYLDINESKIRPMEADYASVKRLRRKGKTLKEIAGIFGVSTAGIGQLLKPNKRCVIHGIYHTIRCYRCARKEKLDKILHRVERDGVMREIKELSVRNRSYEMLSRGRLLIKKLHDGYGLSFLTIGKLLKRHHTSIMNLYYKK